MTPLRIHLLALPNTQTTKAYGLDGFCQATIRFARMMDALGHTVYLYASEENEAPCHELITVITKEEQESLLGMGPWPYQEANIEDWSPLFQLANARMAIEIGKRKQPRDLICSIGGYSQRYVSTKHPELMTVEYSIGYEGSFSDYRVFESYAWMHTTYGKQGIGDGRFFDAVIPCFFDPDEFPVRPTEDYVLYVGRLISRKGVSIACDAAKAAGVPLKIIGFGNQSLITYGEYLGPLMGAERNDYMARAKAVFTPTIYLEPFNCVAVESQLAGTPVISTDWGGMTETVEHGKTGFRCSYLGEFVEAVNAIDQIDRDYVRTRAQATYSMHVLQHAYQRYFDRLALRWTPEGWNSTTTRSWPRVGEELPMASLA